MYDICSCVVALGGDVRQTVPKPIVTVPEILLLQSIHGGDAITNIIITGQEKRTDESIRDELGVMYKDCLLYTSPSPRAGLLSRMPSSA